MIPWRDAKVHVLTHALHYASSVFEGERAYGGAIFQSTGAFRAAKGVQPDTGFRHPVDGRGGSTPPRPRCCGGTISPTPMSGRSRGGERRRSACPRRRNAIHLGIAAWAWPSYFDPAQRMPGVRLDLADYRRPEPANRAVAGQGERTVHDLHPVAGHRAERRGFADALMLDWQGRVAECTAANVFFVKDGALHTPVADCFLSGITRARCDRPRPRAGSP